MENKNYIRRLRETYAEDIKDYSYDMLKDILNDTKGFKRHYGLLSDLDLPAVDFVIETVESELTRRNKLSTESDNSQISLGNLYKDGNDLIMQVIKVKPEIRYCSFIVKNSYDEVWYLPDIHFKDVNKHLKYIAKAKALFKDCWEVKDDAKYK